ncbi:MAG TPA: DUF2752 domain-containing protein [Kineosporiaceae bacterium]
MSSRTSPGRWWSRSVGTAVPGSVAAVAGRLFGPGLVGVVGAAGVLLVTLVDPEQPGHYPVCPTLALTGVYCPGCGGLRALHALTHGEPGLALHRNPVVVLALPFVVWGYLAWVRRRALDRTATWLPSPALTSSLVALLAVFTVLRNLPGFTWLAP